MPGSRRFRWVEVPLDPRPRVDIQYVGVMPHGPGDLNKQYPKRARSWKRRTQPREALSSDAVIETTGGQGVHREVESEGLEEHHRVVIEGSHPEDEPVGQRRGMVEPALWRQRRLGSSSSHQGVCGRHGGEETFVTQGGLVSSERKVGSRYCGTHRRKGGPTANANIDLEPARGRCRYKRERNSGRSGARSRIGAKYS